VSNREFGVKRILALVALILLSIGCFWLAVSATNAPAPPARKAAMANGAGVQGTAAGGTGIITNSGSSPSASSAKRSPMSSGGASSAAAGASGGVVACQTHCQAAGSTCQSDCYQKYNVTNQTHYWSQCMQSCGTSASVCGNNCISGTSLPAISSVFPPPPPAPPPQQTPTRSPPPPAAQDQSSPQSQSR
jgi:hypothetical protein